MSRSSRLTVTDATVLTEPGRVGVEQALAVGNGEEVQAESAVEVVTVTADNVTDVLQ